MSLSQSLFERVDAVRHRLDVDVCSFYIANRRSRLVSIAATSGLNQSAVGAALSWEQGLTGRVARTGKPVTARDIQTHEDYCHIQGSDEEQYKSYLGIPLMRRGRLLGVLVIQTREDRRFHYRDIKELYAAAVDLTDSLLEYNASA